MQPASLGRYHIEKEIGRGAMGRVYLAHDPEIDRHVAIKAIEMPDAEDQHARERFLREARSAGRLLHPGIVTIFDVGETDKLLYLAMEYVEGDTLDHFCRPESLLPVDTVCGLIGNAAEALHYAHRAGIVHRDIKPANVMRFGDGDVKIMDFGLAKPDTSNLTHDGSLFGTPSYMSPEQIRGESLDGRSDLFSLAVVLFEMLTGEKPFPGETISSIIYRIVNEPPRDPAAWESRVSPALGAFLHKALAKDVDQRFPDGAQFRKALDGITESLMADETLVLPRTAARVRSQAAAAEATAPEGVDPLGAAVLGGAAEAESSLPPAPQAPPKSRTWPYLLALLLLLVGGGASAYVFREELGIAEWIDGVTTPAVVTWEATVRTEPPGLPVLLDGQPVEGGKVTFSPEGPFGTLSTSNGCREATHPIQPVDAGGEIVLVPDPLRLRWTVDPGGAGATVKLNGAAVGAAPVEVDLDLCQENTLRVEARGYQPDELTLAAGLTPLEARTALGELNLAAIPKGRLEWPERSVPLVYYVDGKRLGNDPRSLELEQGRHTVRVRNDQLWIDLTEQVQIKAGQTVQPRLALPSLTELTVQAFPPNCKIYLRRGNGEWKYVDDTPSTTRLAAGAYELRVELNSTGETREQRIELKPGANPPVRVSFARQS